MEQMDDKAVNGHETVSRPSYRLPNGANTQLATKAAIIALDSLGASQTKIAAELEIGRSTVRALLKRDDYTDPRIVDRIKREMEARFWVTGARANEAITDEKLNAASALQLMTVQAIATDKALLLSGKPTVRIEHQTVADQEAATKIEELQAALDGWKDGSTINVVGEVVGSDDPSSTV